MIQIISIILFPCKDLFLNLLLKLNFIIHKIKVINIEIKSFNLFIWIIKIELFIKKFIKLIILNRKFKFKSILNSSHKSALLIIYLRIILMSLKKE